MVESFWLAILSNAVIASGLGAVAWFGSRSYRRPALWHVVWVLAIARLFIPPVWAMPMPSFQGPAQASINQVSPTTSAAVSNSVVDLPTDVDSITIASGQAQDPTSAVLDATTESKKTMFLAIRNVSASFLIATAWALGALIVLISSFYRIVRFHVLVRRAVPADQATQALAETTVSLLGVHRNSDAIPNVCMLDHAGPPLLWPVGRTCSIVLPSRWWETTTASQRSTVVMHELVHWRRGDHWVRLLQCLACIAFWWHPIVWVARRELHVLEEQCCDAEVMHRLPEAGRDYASALLSASQWSNAAAQSKSLRFQASSLAMPMASASRFKSFHRRIQMLSTIVYRPLRSRQLAALMLLTAIPLAIGLSNPRPAAIAATPAIASDDSASADNEDTATLSGYVKDADGNSIADARVRLVIPAADLRSPVNKNLHREIFGKTDQQGKYSITVDGIASETSASVDILHSGYQRLVGTFMSGGAFNGEVSLSPNEATKFDAELRNALYFAGQVVDEARKPIEGVNVTSNLNTDRSSAYVEATLTDSEGRFEVHGYQVAHFERKSELPQTTGVVSFRHDRYEDASLKKIEDLDPGKRSELLVVMQTGHSIGGVVKNADGTPARDLAISITQSEPDQRKAMRTDARGGFHFDGIRSGDSVLRVVDVSGNRKVIKDYRVDSDDTEMTLTLEPFESPITQTFQALGVTVADVTEEIKSAFDLNYSQGVMVVDISDRLREELNDWVRPGDVCWMVGKEQIVDLRESVNRLVKEAKSPTVPRGPGRNPSAYIEENGDAKVRVVYGYNDDRGGGTNTQYLKLTPQDVGELEKLQAAFAKASTP